MIKSLSRTRLGTLYAGIISNQEENMVGKKDLKEKTIVFDRFQNIAFPNLCLGCLIPDPKRIMWFPTGSNRKTMAGKFFQKAGILAGGMAFGAIGAVGLERLTGDQNFTAVEIPVCKECLRFLDYEDKKRFKEIDETTPSNCFLVSPYNRRISAGNEIIYCKIKSNKVYLTFKQDSFTEAVIALNEGIVVKEGNALDESLLDITIPTFDDKTCNKYTSSHPELDQTTSIEKQPEINSELEKLNDELSKLSDSEAIDSLIKTMCTMKRGRYYILQSLKKRTGEDFGYESKKWKKWWKKMKKS